MARQLSRRDMLRLGAAAAAAPAAVGAASSRAAARGVRGGASASQTGTAGVTPRHKWIADNWAIRPFALNQVTLGESVFRQKRDRMLDFARNYPGTGGLLDGPNRMLVNFRNLAGLDTLGYPTPGGWESANQLLRGHYTGHYMTLLAQCYADTGEEIFTTKLDYLVHELGVCQHALWETEPIGRADGVFSNAVALSGTNEYVSLPAGIVSGLTDFTVAAWVNRTTTSGQAWARIFDFGTGTGTNMFLTVNAGGAGVRFAITTGGSGQEQRITASPQLPTGWQHVAVTRSGTAGTLYVNGQPVATNTGLTLSPANLGTTTNNWIGRSQYSDPYLSAVVDEFQIYDHALSQAEVASLMDSPGGDTGGGNVAWYRFDEADGPTATDASGTGRDAEIIVPSAQRPSNPGYLSAFPETQFIRLEDPNLTTNPPDVWAPWYTIHKLMRGFLDAYQLTGNDEALEIVLGMADWAHSRLSRLPRSELDRMWNIYSAGEAGGANEVIAELAGLVEDPEKQDEYLETAKAFDFSPMFNALLEGRDILNGRHANTFVPPEIGHLRIHELTGDPDYFTVARTFWGQVVPDRLFANGGTSGPGEFFRVHGVIGRYVRNASSGSRFAESCTAYNMLKLTRNLHLHDPDPAYMDYYELGLVNQILGSRRDVDSDTVPWVTYHQDVYPGASRRLDYTRYASGNGTCCNGTGLENHTKYQETIYSWSPDRSELYVNLYIASTLDWTERGLVLTQETAYPAAGDVTLRVVEGSGPLDLMLRVPSWATKGYAVEVNGVRQQLDAVPGSYATVSREWARGDLVQITMPLPFRAERTPDDPSVQAVYLGPSLLVSLDGEQSTNQNAPVQPWRQLTLYPHYTRDGDFRSAFAPGDTPMHLTSHGYTFRPFYIADPEPTPLRYHMYVERVEPEVVFGSNGTGVPNDDIRDGDGLTFLDRVWEAAPFRNHGQLVSHVETVTTQWVQDGRFTSQQRQAILVAAARAEGELRP